MTQVITPSKGKRLTIQAKDISVRLTGSAAIVEHDDTPHKKLKRQKSLTIPAKPARGRTWDDELRAQLLYLWIEHAEEPFYCWLKGVEKSKSKAKVTIKDLIK